MSVENLFFEERGPRATVADIVELEHQLQMPRLPTPYREYLLRYGNAMPKVKGTSDLNGWSPVPVRWFRNGPVSESGDRMLLDHLYPIHADSPNVTVATTNEDYQHRVPDQSLAFGCDPGNSQFLIDLREKSFGQILFWNGLYEDNSARKADPLYNVAWVAADFNDFLARLEPET